MGCRSRAAQWLVAEAGVVHRQPQGMRKRSMACVTACHHSAHFHDGCRLPAPQTNPL